jgi:hypothetical protein
MIEYDEFRIQMHSNYGTNINTNKYLFEKMKYVYPRGFKTYKILEFISNQPLTYTEIVKFAYELTHGLGSFDKRKHQGYWSSAFNIVSTYPRIAGVYYGGSTVKGCLTDKISKNDSGKYEITDEGRHYMNLYSEKFKNIVPCSFNFEKI